jgi:hypothetical protein
MMMLKERFPLFHRDDGKYDRPQVLMHAVEQLFRAEGSKVSGNHLEVRLRDGSIKAFDMRNDIIEFTNFLVLVTSRLCIPYRVLPTKRLVKAYIDFIIILGNDIQAEKELPKPSASAAV